MTVVMMALWQPGAGGLVVADDGVRVEASRRASDVTQPAATTSNHKPLKAALQNTATSKNSTFTPF